MLNFIWVNDLSIQELEARYELTTTTNMEVSKNEPQPGCDCGEFDNMPGLTLGKCW